MLSEAHNLQMERTGALRLSALAVYLVLPAKTTLDTCVNREDVLAGRRHDKHQMTDAVVQAKPPG